MITEFTIREWKPWTKNGEILLDRYGNQVGTVTFQEHHNEPIDASFKPPIQVGQKIIGVIEDYITKSGNYRTRFITKRVSHGYRN